MVIAQTYAALRERALIAGDMFQLMLELHNADQPRAPAGQPNGGQWVGEGSGGSVQLAGGLDKVNPDANIGQFISENCLGSIHRKMPGQFYSMTIGEMLALRGGGDRAAGTCYKLLNEKRFRK